MSNRNITALDLEELNLAEMDEVSGGMMISVSNFETGAALALIGIGAVAAAPELGIGVLGAISWRLAGGALVSGGTWLASH